MKQDLSALAADVTYLAAPSFDSIKDTVITLAGTAVIIIVVIRMLTAYAQRRWGEMITEFLAVIFVGWFVWDTDGAINTLKDFVTQIFG